MPFTIAIHPANSLSKDYFLILSNSETVTNV